MRRMFWILGFPLRLLIYAVAWFVTATILGDGGNKDLAEIRKGLW